jgi:hypothetical protein
VYPELITFVNGIDAWCSTHHNADRAAECPPDGFSKKLENPPATVALYSMYDNFAACIRPSALRQRWKLEFADHVWSIEELVGLLDGPQRATRRKGRDMKFNPKAFLVLVGFGVLLVMTSSSNGGGWFHFAEAVASAVILLGVAGFLRENGARTSARI